MYGDDIALTMKDMKKLSCPVVEVYKHSVRQRHVYIFCKSDKRKTERLIDYLKWF